VPHLALQPVRVATGEDEEGRLVLVDDCLIAVLVRLSRQHGEIAGHWFLEASFGPALDAMAWPTFPDLKAAERWIVSRIAEQG